MQSCTTLINRTDTDVTKNIGYHNATLLELHMLMFSGTIPGSSGCTIAYKNKD